MSKFLVVLMTMMMVLIDPVLAQVVTPAATTPITIVPPGGVIDYGQAFGWLQPYVVSVVGTLVLAIGGWLTYLIQKYTGYKIDETLSQAYILNAQNQAKALITKGFVAIKEDGKVQINNSALAAAVNDLLKAVPDATTRFDLKPDKVAEKIVAMVPQAPTVAAVTVVEEVSRKSK